MPFKHGGASKIWRDYVVDNDVSSGFYEPDKAEIRDYLKDIEARLEAVASFIFNDDSVSLTNTIINDYYQRLGAGPGGGIIAPGSPEALLQAVCLIPGSTEWGYGTTTISRLDNSDAFLNWENRNTNYNISDLEVSITQLKAAAPNVNTIVFVVSWFGTSADIATCQIAPRVETGTKNTSPRAWAAGTYTRDSAAVMSTIAGNPVYGSSPDSTSVVECITYLKNQGYRVIMYPFLLIDDGANYPWRGRIASSVDGTAQARNDTEAFFRTRGYNVFIEHLADLCNLAGGVYGFCVGSELRGITRIRDNAGAYPGVDELITAVATIKAKNCADKVGYAADWTEYRYHQIDSNNLIYNMDKLWKTCDFIAIDDYLPRSDFRQDINSIEANLYANEYVKSLLFANMEGGQDYDWFYASAADRVNGVRTLISTPEYRQKDIRHWWKSQHFNLVAGVRSSTPTEFIPQGKEIWITETNAPAIDKGANQPNVFVTQYSSESAAPFGSLGTRDDFIQRAFLETYLQYWLDNNPDSIEYTGKMIGLISAWAWDARPWPEFPQSTFWGDGPDYQTGHWLNGRLGVPIRSGIESIPKDSYNPNKFFIQALNLSGKSSVSTTKTVPARSVIKGVFSQVLVALTGSETYNVGDSGDGAGVSASINRYAANLGGAVDGYLNKGIVTPFPIFGDVAITVNKTSGTFTSGTVLVIVFYEQQASPNYRIGD